MQHLKTILLATLSLGILGCGQGGGSKTTFVTIGTGGVTGVYYPAGGAIAKMINAKTDTYHLRASAESTGGSVYNINAVLSGDLEFGIAQSDRNFQAWNGVADWEGRPQGNLRSVFSLHPEIVTLVAAEDSGIRILADLQGKRVNLGNPGSGHRGNAMDILRTAGIDPDTDLTAESLKASEAPKMLQDGRLDAFFYTVGHPNGAMQEATNGKRKVRFIPLINMEPLLKEFPYYATATIPASLYPQAANQTDVVGIGVMTTFVTSASVPDDVVYAITKEVFTGLDAFKELHPALGQLTPASMLEGLTAPLHPGAERYFAEAGLMK
jgi:TRAP transporter TAXI family solute receptor